MNTVLDRPSEAQALESLREMTVDTDEATGEELAFVTAEDVLDLEITLADEALGFYPDTEVYRLAAYFYGEEV